MKITEHFSREEFDQPARHGFVKIPYPEKFLPELTKLCEQLEIIRAKFNSPITILSGYRSIPYNIKIGGARFSQHVLGKAADISILSVKPEDVYQEIAKLYLGGRVNIGGLGKYPGFTHVDVRPGRLVWWNGGRIKN